VKLREILVLLDGCVVPEDADLDKEITTAFGADLMSDVLALSHSGSLLLTGLTNPQVVRTAEMSDITAIAIVRGKVPPPETIALAVEKRIPLILSPHTLFECCGRLYAAGVVSCDVRDELRDVSR
jgi:hypothetical protein